MLCNSPYQRHAWRLTRTLGLFRTSTSMYAYVYERLGENVGPSLRKLTYTLRQHPSQAYLSQLPEELCSWLAIWLHLAVNWTCRLRRLCMQVWMSFIDRRLLIPRERSLGKSLMNNARAFDIHCICIRIQARHAPDFSRTLVGCRRGLVCRHGFMLLHAWRHIWHLMWGLRKG